MISKKRLVLISVLTILLVVGGLYATYAINVFEEETTPTEYDMAFNFDLSGSVTREMTVEAGKTKVFDLDITNPYSDTIQYGVAYSLVSPTTLPSGVTIAESNLSKSAAVGMIDSNETISVSIVVVNETSSSVTLSFSVINGYKNGGDLIVESGKILVEEEYQVVPLTPKQVLENLRLTDLLQEGSPDFSVVATTDEGIYAVEDDLGTSYYFRGASGYNYVKFGKWSSDTPDVYYGYYTETSRDYKEYSSLNECENATYYNVNCTLISRAGKDMYWRILRINGDGSIRIIYDGTSVHENGEVTDDKQIGITSFNRNGDNAYVGYMYGTIGASNYLATHSNITDSNIKAFIEDTWYTINIKNTEYEKYIVDAIYCNDRKVSTTDSFYTGDGSGSTSTKYKASERVFGSKIEPVLTCSQPNDRFTLESSNFSIETNGMLDAPVGLITADEIVFAGGTSGNNESYYLYNGTFYWTMTPYYNSGDTYVFNVGETRCLDYNGYTPVIGGVRPVISIKPETIKYGDGTMGNPFRLEEEI